MTRSNPARRPAGPNARVQRIYERRPYPFGDARALQRSGWQLSLDWIRSFGRDGDCPPPGRVLVAGCGDGSEAFSLQRQLPEAEIVAVDFSPRSVALARRLQRRDPALRRIRFEVADLAAPGLARTLGGTFDLITCHGVLTYVPGPGRVLRNFAQCLDRRGALYLGVNGASHQSGRLRQALSALGLDLGDFREDARTRSILGLCDAVLAGDNFPRISAMGAPYVASDIFGTPNHMFPLSQWTGLARSAGLRFRASSSSVRIFRLLAEEGKSSQLIPRSRAQLATLFELLVPARFHRLIFSLIPEANPPWQDRRRLYRWTPERSRLYRFRLPKPGRTVRDRLRSVTISSTAFDTLTAWRMPEWEVELLRPAAAGRNLENLLDRLPLAIPFADVRDQLYILHQLGIVTLRPPVSPA